MTEEDKPQDECFDNCPLYDDGKCRTRYIMKLVSGEDFLIAGCGTKEQYLRSLSPETPQETTDETPASDGADEEKT